MSGIFWGCASFVLAASSRGFDKVFLGTPPEAECLAITAKRGLGDTHAPRGAPRRLEPVDANCGRFQRRSRFHFRSAEELRSGRRAGCDRAAVAPDGLRFGRGRGATARSAKRETGPFPSWYSLHTGTSL